MRINPHTFMHGARCLAPVSLLLFASCGGGGGAPAAPPPPTSFTIGGTITNYTGSGLTLRNNGGDDLTVASGSTSYTFATSVASGGSYSVTVLTNPGSPTQFCSVTGTPSGSGLSANITNANVTCVNAYTIGGNIFSSVAGIGPTLQNNGANNLFVPAIINGSTPFTFSTPVASGGAYNVTQLTKASAPTQNCVVTSGTGTNVLGDISGVVVTCTVAAAVPKFAYVANNTANTVSAYTINPATGVLSIPSAAASGSGPYSIAVDPGSKYAYVTNSLADSVSGYVINPTSGALTLISDVDAGTAGTQSGIATGDIPYSITIHPSAKFAYVANQGIGTTSGNTISAYSINAINGTLTAIDADGATIGTQATIATGTHPYAVMIDPTGKFVYVANYDSNNISAYTIDQTNGALASVGTAVAAGTNPTSIAIDPAGKCALVTNLTSDNVMSYTINATTGALSLVSTVTSGALSNPRSVAIDPATGQFAYVANANSASVSAFSVNSTTCAIASVDTDAVTVGVNTTIPAGATPLSISVDPSGKYVYVANFGSINVSAYSIDVSGALTALAGSPFTAGSGPVSVTTAQ